MTHDPLTLCLLWCAASMIPSKLRFKFSLWQVVYYRSISSEQNVYQSRAERHMIQKHIFDEEIATPRVRVQLMTQLYVTTSEWFMVALCNRNIECRKFR